MAGSVEHKIFQESPTAPTPHELREGICLLLDTFGHPEYHYAVDPQNREPFTFNQLSGGVRLS